MSRTKGYSSMVELLRDLEAFRESYKRYESRGGESIQPNTNILGPTQTPPFAIATPSSIKSGGSKTLIKYLLNKRVETFVEVTEERIKGWGFNEEEIKKNWPDNSYVTYYWTGQASVEYEKNKSRVTRKVDSCEVKRSIPRKKLVKKLLKKMWHSLKATTDNWGPIKYRKGDYVTAESRGWPEKGNALEIKVEDSTSLFIRAVGEPDWLQEIDRKATDPFFI